MAKCVRLTLGRLWELDLRDICARNRAVWLSRPNLHFIRILPKMAWPLQNLPVLGTSTRLPRRRKTNVSQLHRFEGKFLPFLAIYPELNTCRVDLVGLRGGRQTSAFQ